MALLVRYKNACGCLEMKGSSKGRIFLTAIEGLGLAEREYRTAVFSGYDGQETLSSRAIPRTITLTVEFCVRNTSEAVAEALNILASPGYLYVEDERISRRIYCNQVKIPDPERILKNRISGLAVQFVCDSPFFEDSRETSVALYERTKELSTEFSLPCMFGTTVMGAEIRNVGTLTVEPVIRIYCTKELENAETVVLRNNTTGKKLEISYAPCKGEEIVVDVKNRKVKASQSGNIVNNLSDDSFLGDFVLVPGLNRIEAFVGDVSSGFAVECRYSNLYSEAVIV